MKKITLTISLILAFLISNGQLIIDETFSSGTFPPEGWSISANAENWSAVSSSNAGGQAPEARLNWSPAFNASSYLIMPEVNLSVLEASNVIVSFKHMVDHYSDTYDIGLAARTDGGDWSNIWSQEVSSGIPSETKEFMISDVDILNSSQLEFAIFFSGNSYNINYWYIDDVKILAPTGLDLAITEVDIDDVFHGIIPLSGTVQNYGAEEITSFDLNWRINYGEVQSHSYTDLAIESYGSYDFNIADVIDLTPGSHNISVFINNINGQQDDNDTENNNFFKQFNVAHNAVSRKPLFESFTSSTCPPCYSFNTGFFNEFTSNNADDITLIKYQMNWPGSGDPYYNADGGIRRTYYGISGVPSLIIEGSSVSLSEEAINAALEEGKNKPAYILIESSFDIDGDLISVFGNILPYSDFGEATLHIAVFEGTTYDNATSNGETFFKHVMHKMLPDGNGADINFNTMETSQFLHQFDMSSTFVEEMDNLNVLVFIQNNSTKEIYQSQYAKPAAAPVATFNVVETAQNVALDKVFTISFDQPVKNEDGSALTSENVADIIGFNTLIRRAAVSFSAEINDNKTQITVTPDANLDPNQGYKIEVLPLMGINGAISETSFVEFSTRDLMGAPIVSFEILDGEENVDIYTPLNVYFNQPVKNTDGEEFTNETAADRVIFKTENSAGTDVPFTVEVNDEKTMFSVIPNESLDFTAVYYLEILPVMGVEDDLSTAESISFTTRESIGAPNVVFSIEDGEIDVDVYETVNVFFSQSVKNIDGEEFTNETAADRVVFKNNDSEGSDVNFTVEVNESGDMFSIIPDNRLDFVADYYVEILPVMGVEGDISEAVSVSFTTRESIGAPTVEFNVGDGETDIAIDMVFVVTFSQTVRNTDESAITEDNADQNIVFETEDGDIVEFNVSLNGDNTEFTITPTSELSSLTTYYLAILPVMGEEDDITDTEAISFTTVEIVGINEFFNENISVFPNPANDFITIDLGNYTEKAEISIYDISGKIVLNKTITEENAKLDISNIPNGMYLIKISDGINTFNGKFNKVSN